MRATSCRKATCACYQPRFEQIKQNVRAYLFQTATNLARDRFRQRPFDVVAGGTLTRALGTEFNVDLRDAQVTVSVLDGAVRVLSASETTTPEGAGGSAAALPTTALGKGQALEVHSNQRQVREDKADLKRIEAWRTRRLEFSDTPLATAVDEFNRYSTLRVVIGTPELSAIRVSGVFRIGDPESFLYTLREALGIETHEAVGEVVLMRSHQAEPG